MPIANCTIKVGEFAVRQRRWRWDAVGQYSKNRRSAPVYGTPNRVGSIITMTATIGRERLLHLLSVLIFSQHPRKYGVNVHCAPIITAVRLASNQTSESQKDAGSYRIDALVHTRIR